MIAFLCQHERTGSYQSLRRDIHCGRYVCGLGERHFSIGYSQRMEYYIPIYVFDAGIQQDVI